MQAPHPFRARRAATLTRVAGLVALCLSPNLVAQGPATSRPAPEAPAGRILYLEESGGFAPATTPATTPGTTPRTATGAAPNAGASAKPAASASAKPAASASAHPPAGTPTAGSRPAAAVVPLIPPLPPPKLLPDMSPPKGKQAAARKPTVARPGRVPQAEPLATARPSAPIAPPALPARTPTAAAVAAPPAPQPPSTESQVVEARDAEAATLLGWRWLEAGDAASAALWFNRAFTWAPEKLEAKRGLALAALAERDYARALDLTHALPEDASRANVRRDARLGIAQRHYRSERYGDASNEFTAAATEGELPRYARALHAWSLMNQGLRKDAGERFAQLYREAPDLETAQGMLATASAAPLDPSLATLEPLATLVRQRDGQVAFRERRFLEARALDAATYADHGATSARHAALAHAWRDKSGTRGESQLRLREGAELSAYTPLESASLRARVARRAIDSGPGTQAVAMEEGDLTLRFERGVAVEASLGRAAVGGPVGGRTTATLDVAATPGWGQASLAVLSLPVRESVLAHAGIRDANGARGRVFRNAIEARALWLEAAPFSLGARASVARLAGRGVESNDYRGAEIAAGYDLGWKGFTYAAASLAASDERYDHNLSGFAPGQGGYFSPQRYRRVGLAFDFLTEERRAWIVRGRASAGHVVKREDATESRGNDSNLQLAGAVAITPHIHAAFALSRGQSPQYRETQALLQVQLLIEPRLTVASADLPGFPR